MMKLIICVVLLVFVPYVMAVYSYKHIKKVSTNDAACVVKEWILCELQGLSCKQPLEYNPTLDRDMQSALLDSLRPYNALASENVYMDWVKYLGTELPSILIKFVPNNGEKDFGLIISVLKTLFYDKLVFRGFQSPLVDVTITKNDSNYLIWIIYATIPTNRKQFLEHFYNMAIEAQKKAQKLVAPVIDDDLEKELTDIKQHYYGEKNE